MKTAVITAALVVACQAMLQDPGITSQERDAASITLTLHSESKPVDEHVASVLMSYAQRQGKQNRYGK